MTELPPPPPASERMAISESSAPTGFVFPGTFAAMMSLPEPPDLTPMYFLVSEYLGAVSRWTEILEKQFPDRVLVPFARYDGTDDVYCFDGNDLSGDPIVVLIHSFTTPGWEYRGEWVNFDSWHSSAAEFHELWLKDELEDFETGTRTSSAEES